jgi:hypothetical protein
MTLVNSEAREAREAREAAKPVKQRSYILRINMCYFFNVILKID